MNIYIYILSEFIYPKEINTWARNAGSTSE